MRRFAAFALATSAVLAAGSASASFHLTKIVEVNVGTDSYVELEAYSSGQNFLASHTVTVYSNADDVLDTITLANVANGANHARVLIGTPTVEGKFGVKPDIATLKTMNPTGGKVCFDGSPADCFSWGNYPTKTGTGTPFTFAASMAAARNVSGGITTELDGTEDTDQSSVDFTSVTPAPKNNTFGVVPPDAGGSTTSSTGGTDAGTDAGSSGTTPGGGTSTSGAATSGGPGPGESAGTTSTSGAVVTPANPAGEDDGGCNTTGDNSSFALAPILGLIVAGALARRHRR